MLGPFKEDGRSRPFSKYRNPQPRFRRSNSNRPTSAAQDFINSGDRGQIGSRNGYQRASDASGRSNSLPPQAAAFTRPPRSRMGRRGGSRGHHKPMQMNGTE